MKKLFVCLLMLLGCAAMAMAEDMEPETYTEGAFVYTLTEEGAVIPEGVEEIGSCAFYDWEFAQVILPESLRLIESDAFYTHITEPVIIPAGVETVQYGAFCGVGGGEIEVIATSESTHFETADEYEARTGYRHWMDN